MVKQGIFHDYDLLANAEESSHNVVCAICGKMGVTFQWSDYSGEAMCTRCGCPYQLKWGSDKQVAEGKYPYLNLKENFLPVAKKFWNESKQFVCYGAMLGPQPGMDSLVAWLRGNHPEFLSEPGEEG